MNEKARARYEARAKIIKALAHPSRLFIVDELNRGKRCVGELTEMIGTDASTVSKHLSVLKNAGLVRDEKVGSSVYYEFVAPCVSNFFDCIEAVIRANVEKQLELITE